MRKQKILDLSKIYGRDIPLDVGQERWQKLPYRMKWRIAMAFAAAAGIKPKKGYDGLIPPSCSR
jgi:hypothetical protein